MTAPAAKGRGRPAIRLAAVLGLSLLGLLWPLLACAASLQVSPILLEFAPQEQSQALWLTNSGHAPLRAQVRAMAWTQANGTETLSPTRDLVASPALIEIAPGAQQLIRIVRPRPATVDGERAYRLIVDELPDEVAQERTGLQFLLRYSIPAFVGPPVPVAAGVGRAVAAPLPPTDLSALSGRLDAGELQVTNTGPRRVRISQLEWVNADGSRVPLARGLLGYVLAGQRMHWPLTLPAQARPGGVLEARFDNDVQAQTLPSAAPVR